MRCIGNDAFVVERRPRLLSCGGVDSLSEPLPARHAAGNLSLANVDTWAGATMQAAPRAGPPCHGISHSPWRAPPISSSLVNAAGSLFAGEIGSPELRSPSVVCVAGMA